MSPAEAGAREVSGQAFGRPRRHYRRTDSTNERARELAERGAPHGTVVTATEQTAGRGRGGRAWSAPPGKAVLYSAILRPLAARHALLPLAVPIAVCEAVEALAPVRCRVKWPNDVWLEERKVAGILIEARPGSEGGSAGAAGAGEAAGGWAVIGIGVNVSIEPDEFPSDVRWPATSVGHGATVEAALSALNDRLTGWVDASPERVLSGFRERDALRGRGVAWEGGPRGWETGSGVAEGIDDAGNLLVRSGAGEQVALAAGDVHLSLG